MWNPLLYPAIYARCVSYGAKEVLVKNALGDMQNVCCSVDTKPSVNLQKVCCCPTKSLLLTTSPTHTQHFCPFQNQKFMPQSAKIVDMMHSKMLKRRTFDEGMLKNVKIIYTDAKNAFIPARKTSKSLAPRTQIRFEI